MSKLQIFKWSKSLISSKLLSELSASDISVHIKPFDFACANLVLLSLVKSEAVLISINQTSNCEESLPLNIVITWSRVFTKDVFFVQYIKCLYIVVKLHQEVLAVLMGEV